METYPRLILLKVRNLFYLCTLLKVPGACRLITLYVFFLDILYEMSQPKVLTTTVCESLSISSYKCDISNKYFSTSISLIAFDGSFESVPSEIRKSTEALIIYFDPSDVST